MLNKFISGLSAAGKIVFSIAVIAVVLALFDRLFLGPSNGKIKDIEEKIVSEEIAVKQDLKFLEHRDGIITEASAYRDFYTSDVRAEDEVVAEFLKKVELMATQAQVETSKITPAGKEYQTQYLKYLVTLDCSGKFENITNFVYALNNARELFRVEKLNIIGNTRDAEKVTANVTVSRMIMGADPSMDAKSLVKIKEEIVLDPVKVTDKKSEKSAK